MIDFCAQRRQKSQMNNNKRSNKNLSFLKNKRNKHAINTLFSFFELNWLLFYVTKSLFSLVFLYKIIYYNDFSTTTFSTTTSDRFTTVISQITRGSLILLLFCFCGSLFYLSDHSLWAFFSVCTHDLWVQKRIYVYVYCIFWWGTTHVVWHLHNQQHWTWTTFLL